MWLRARGDRLSDAEHERAPAREGRNLSGSALALPRAEGREVVGFLNEETLCVGRRNSLKKNKNFFLDEFFLFP